MRDAYVRNHLKEDEIKMNWPPPLHSDPRGATILLTSPAKPDLLSMLREFLSYSIRPVRFDGKPKIAENRGLPVLDKVLDRSKC